MAPAGGEGLKGRYASEKIPWYRGHSGLIPVALLVAGGWLGYSFIRARRVAIERVAAVAPCARMAFVNPGMGGARTCADRDVTHVGSGLALRAEITCEVPAKPMFVWRFEFDEPRRIVYVAAGGRIFCEDPYFPDEARDHLTP